MNATECLAKMGEAVLTNQEVLNAFAVKDIKANSVKKVRHAEVFTMFQKYVKVLRSPTTRREYRVAHPFLSFILV